MNDHAIGPRAGPELLLFGGELEEPKRGGGVESELAEDVDDEVIGEIEGELGNGAEAVEDGEAGDAFDQLGLGKLELVLGPPVGGTTDVE